MGIDVKIPKFRGSYVSLDKPKKVKGSEKETFSIMALFEPGQDISVLKKAALEAAKEKWGDKAEAVLKHPKFKTPFKDQAELVDADGEQRPGTVAGGIFLNLSNVLKPLVLNQAVEEITDPRDAYSGAYYVAKASVYAWEHDVGGKGITFSLLGVQKVAEGEKLGGTGSRASTSDFEPVETAGDTASDMFD